MPNHTKAFFANCFNLFDQHVQCIIIIVTIFKKTLALQHTCSICFTRDYGTDSLSYKQYYTQHCTGVQLWKITSTEVTFKGGKHHTRGTGEGNEGRVLAIAMARRLGGTEQGWKISHDGKRQR